jgi:membrane-associated protease RseP (regulator of RpoE activity)
MVEFLNLAFTLREIFLVLFVVGLGTFLYWDRKKIQRHYILFYRRTERGIDLIDRIARAAPRFWNIYGWAGVATGFLSVLVGSVLFLQGVGSTIREPGGGQGASLLLPGLVDQNQFQAGISFVPLEYWLVGIGILMVVHEMSHGIVARSQGFELNSVGWIIMGILPGAFVEPKGENMLPGDEANKDPDTDMWEQGNWKQRLKVLGAGSFANYLTGALFLLLGMGMMSAVSTSSDVQYVASPNYSAYDSGMRNGSLVQINGQDIENTGDVMQVSNELEVNETITVWSSEGNFTFQASKDPDTSKRFTQRAAEALGLREVEDESKKGFIGIRVGQFNVIEEPYAEHQALLSWFISMIQTIGLLNILIGIFNMLPVKPLDGGLMFETVIERYAPDRVDAVNAVSLAGWTLILGSMIVAIASGII